MGLRPMLVSVAPLALVRWVRGYVRSSLRGECPGLKPLGLGGTLPRAEARCYSERQGGGVLRQR